MSEAAVSIEKYCLKVAVPSSAGVVLSVKNSIDYAEKYFQNLRDRTTKGPERKVELDRARALLKFAACCGGELENYRSMEHKLVFTLCFSNKENMEQFAADVNAAVEGAI